MPKPKLSLNPSSEGNLQNVSLQYDKQGNTTLTYTLYQTCGKNVPLFTKEISINYNKNRLEDGINIMHSVEPNKRQLQQYGNIDNDYFSHLGQNINERFSSLNVNGSITDKYNPKVKDTMFTLDDTLLAMQQIPNSLINQDYKSELDKVNFSEMVDYISQRAERLEPKGNVIRLPKRTAPAEYELAASF